MGYARGIKWNEELIKNEIHKVMKALNIERMPSVDEINTVTHNAKLANAIKRRGGFYYWADKLGIKIKESETKLGKEYEEHLRNKLIERGYQVEQMSVKHPYDVLVNESIKIDVKVSRRYYYNDTGYYYTFNIEKKNSTCDLYVCWCIKDNNIIDKILVIPGKDLKITQLSIGATSEYDKYNNRWDLIKKFDDFYKQLA